MPERATTHAPASRHRAALGPVALCRELPALAPDDPLPEWLLLAPAGEIQGRDGRRFSNPNAAAVVMRGTGAAIPVDWEHATHLRAPQGLPAPAVGWVVALQARPGPGGDAVWGQVEWTPEGAAALRERAYRYYSPAYLLDPKTRAITEIPSVGLTNQPNLDLPALNASEDSIPMTPEPILTALGLPADADEAAVLAAIEALRSSAQTPSLNAFAPRADLEAALNRATQAETALRQAQQAELDREIEALLQQGLTAARITPATLEYHRAQARTEGGLERLKGYLAAAPAVVTDESRAAKPPAVAPELNAEARAIAAAFGHTPEILAKYGAAQ